MKIESIIESLTDLVPDLLKTADIKGEDEAKKALISLLQKHPLVSNYDKCVELVRNMPDEVTTEAEKMMDSTGGWQTPMAHGEKFSNILHRMACCCLLSIVHKILEITLEIEDSKDSNDQQGGFHWRN